MPVSCAVGADARCVIGGEGKGGARPKHVGSWERCQCESNLEMNAGSRDSEVVWWMG